MEDIEAKAAKASTCGTPRIEATLNGSLNLADFQNAVPLLRGLSIVNETVDKIEDIELTIFSEPAFLKPKRGEWMWLVRIAGIKFLNLTFN